MPPFIAYHGVSGAEHQQRVDTLPRQGYRPISIGVSGEPPNIVFCAVWVQRPGGAWQALHNLSEPDYQRRLNEWVAQGYAPVLVSVAGRRGNETFAALFEKGVAVGWFARHGLRWGQDIDPDTINFENARAARDNFVPRSLSVYGTPEDRRFAGVWFQNSPHPTNPLGIKHPVAWSWWFDTADNYDRIFKALTAGGMRPSWISAAPDRSQLSVFRDDQIGQGWARHDISATAYQNEFNLRVSEGEMPIVVQAGGTGRATRYSAIFARTETPTPRRFSRTGSIAPSLSGIDDTVTKFMREHAIRAGALFARKSDAALVRRGYTWAEHGYPITQPDSRFRMASLSKIFTAAAIDRLVNIGRLNWTTTAYPALGITGVMLASQAVDPRVDTITVRNLVEHYGGLKEAEVIENGVPRRFEPTADLRTVAARLSLVNTPTRHDIARYMHGEKLNFTPGAQFDYSNFGYVLLSLLVEKASGRNYLKFVRDEVLAPLGLSQLWVGGTARVASVPGEVSYDDAAVGLSVFQPTVNTWAPNAYGGAFDLEVIDGSGGLVSTAETIARVISQHAVWDAGPRVVNNRNGRLAGTLSHAASRNDGIDFVYLFNRSVGDGPRDAFTAALNAHFDAF